MKVIVQESIGSHLKWMDFFDSTHCLAQQFQVWSVGEYRPSPLRDSGDEVYAIGDMESSDSSANWF